MNIFDFPLKTLYLSGGVVPLKWRSVTTWHLKAHKLSKVSSPSTVENSPTEEGLPSLTPPQGHSVIELYKSADFLRCPIPGTLQRATPRESPSDLHSPALRAPKIDHSPCNGSVTIPLQYRSGTT